MRAIILVTGAVLALAACSNNGQAGNTTNMEQGLTAENIASNDVTAIDAVTGDAANMAADMDVGFTNEMDDNLANAAAPARPASRPAAKPEPDARVPATNGTTATNKAAVTNRAAANETANATE